MSRNTHPDFKSLNPKIKNAYDLYLDFHDVLFDQYIYDRLTSEKEYLKFWRNDKHKLDEIKIITQYIDRLYYSNYGEKFDDGNREEHFQMIIRMEYEEYSPLYIEFDVKKKTNFEECSCYKLGNMFITKYIKKLFKMKDSILSQLDNDYKKSICELLKNDSIDIDYNYYDNYDSDETDYDSDDT